MPASLRIIPAYAGNTFWSMWSSRSSGDHLRLRGEHDTRFQLERGIEGSSPLTRGTRVSLSIISAPPGIIPAYAGNTPRWRISRSCVQDHPRLRGEHIIGIISHRASAGSSPLTRGTLIVAYLRLVDPGIIPAYAGNTGFPSHLRPCTQDHPRLRGEHTRLCPVGKVPPGSSPLTRGTHRDRNHDRMFRRIIPAYAGNTWSLPTNAPPVRDHPRLRGEHSQM